MQQAHAVAALLKGLRAGLPNISIGMFTGYSPRELEEGRFSTRQESDKEERIHFWQSIRKHLDFAVIGRYNRLQPSTDPLCTSRNQKLHIFSSRHSNADSANRL
jgi:anaerobic ribonucleoside-triphosphate reductase activating protein